MSLDSLLLVTLGYVREWMSTLFVFLCTFLLVYINTRRQHGVPPGPTLLPVIGNLHNLVGTDFKGTLRKLRQRYGDVFGLYIGKELTVFLNGYDVLNDALVKHGRMFSSRPLSVFHRLAMKYPGIFFGDGKFWREQRTFTLKSLQEICFQNGGRNIENIVQEELDHLIERLGLVDGAVAIDEYLHTSVGNVICMVLHSKRFDFEDKEFNTVLTYLRELTEEFTARGTITYCFPFLNILPGDVLGIRRMLTKAEAIRAVFWPPSEPPRPRGTRRVSVTDLYLDKIAANEGNSESSFTENNMQSTLYDLRAAGIDTTAGVILWTILYLIRNPGIQARMFEEIKTVIGLDTEPTNQDRHDVPYVEAVILEAMRVAYVVPFALPHTVSKDIVFHGYQLPANCTIITYLESAMKDPSVWDNPDEFRPERFLSDDKTMVVIPKEFIPFSMGPRSCLGESLARIEIFIFIATLVQKFEFLPEVDGVLPEAKGHLGTTWRPNSYKIRVVKR